VGTRVRVPINISTRLHALRCDKRKSPRDSARSLSFSSSLASSPGLSAAISSANGTLAVARADRLIVCNRRSEPTASASRDRNRTNRGLLYDVNRISVWRKYLDADVIKRVLFLPAALGQKPPHVPPRKEWLFPRRHLPRRDETGRGGRGD